MGNKIEQQDLGEAIVAEPDVTTALATMAALDDAAAAIRSAASNAEPSAKHRRRPVGVNAVLQALEGLPRSELTRSDEIAERAVAILRSSADEPLAWVEIKVVQGWVTLTWMVDPQGHRRRTEAEIRKIAGVRGITNVIDIR